MKKTLEKAMKIIGTLLLLAFLLAPIMALAETDRITVEDPGTSAIKFKVTSDGNVTGASYTAKDSSGNTKFLLQNTGQLALGTTSASMNPSAMNPPVNIQIVEEGIINPMFSIDGASDNPTTKPVMQFIKSRGTHAAPAALKNNDWIGQFQLKGYNGSAYDNRRVFQVETSEDWTPTAGGYRFTFYTRSNGTVGTPPARVTFDHNGNVGIGTTSPTQLIDVNGNGIRIRTSMTPASATATCDQGNIAWDNNYVYVCVATDSWKRAGLAAW